MMEPELKNRDNFSVKSEFCAIPYYCKLVQVFQVSNKWFFKFGSDPVDLVDKAVATLQTAVTSLRRAWTRESQRLKSHRRGYVKKLHNCLDLIAEIDRLHLNKQIFDASKRATDALRTAPDVDQVVTSIDDLAEQVDRVRQLDDLMSEPISAEEEVSDQDLEEELRELQQIEDALIEKNLVMPTVPKRNPVQISGESKDAVERNNSEQPLKATLA